MNESSIWLLNFEYDNILDLVYPYFKIYADKIHADINIINERKFPDWHITYEKAQVYEGGKNYKWNLLFDTDVLLHPHFPDLTKRVDKYKVGIKDSYNCKNRFKVNNYFFRDDRYIGICGVFAMSSYFCHDVFKPLPLTQEYYITQINLDEQEPLRGVTEDRFITEYWLSNNLSKYSLKYQGILSNDELYMFHHPYGRVDNKNIFHSYTDEEKIQLIKNKIKIWKELE